MMCFREGIVVEGERLSMNKVEWVPEGVIRREIVLGCGWSGSGLKVVVSEMKCGFWSRGGLKND